MKSPLITVIIPVFNSEKFIKSALESVFKQNYPNLEVIAVDDGSTDSSLEILKQFDKTIKIISQENQGPAGARNTGIKQANGSLIAFLDADDLWTNNHFESMLPFLSENSQYEAVRGYAQYFKQIDNEICKYPEKVFIHESAAAGLYRATVFEKVGVFDPTLRHGEDTDWIIRFNTSSCREKRIEETVLLYRRHQNNITNSGESTKKALLNIVRKKLQRDRSGSGTI
jgi:glycosyltransferase involved in cell wall biosynthesis